MNKTINKEKNIELFNPFDKLFDTNFNNNNNHIYFYSDVTTHSCLSLNKNINELPDPYFDSTKSFSLPDVHWISVYHPDILTCPPFFASVLRIPRVYPWLLHFLWKSLPLNPSLVPL